MQCPLCGKTVPELLNGLCAQCASERLRFLDVPDVIDIVRCAHCGRVQAGHTWTPSATSEPDALVLERVHDEVHIDPPLDDGQIAPTLAWEDERNLTLHLVATGRFHGHAVRREADLRVRLKTNVCPDCSREKGGYFEAIVQVRAEAARVLEREGPRLVDWIERQMGRYKSDERPGAYVSRSELVRGGIDLYMGSKEIARLLAASVAERYGATMHDSAKLVGRKDGRDLTRTTHVVRLPGYLPGDFLSVDGVLFKLLRIDRRRLTLWDLERGETTHREPKFTRKVKVIGTAQDQKDAVVVSRFGTNLQVLDPATFKTVDMAVAKDLVVGETVPVFRNEDRLYLLPASAA